MFAPTCGARRAIERVRAAGATWWLEAAAPADGGAESRHQVW
jgi:hypothetical protein